MVLRKLQLDVVVAAGAVVLLLSGNPVAVLRQRLRPQLIGGRLLSRS
jgi:hypothetical protein